MKFILVLSFCFLSLFSYSQKITVSGFIRDSITNEPLIGATIWDNTHKLGTSTDNFGHFSLLAPLDTEMQFVASFIGYQSKPSEIITNDNVRLDFDLTAGISLGEIEVRGEKKIENRIEMGMITLPIATIKELPVLGEPDVLKVMQLMPGIQGGSEGRSGLYVRGGSPDQNLMLLDGASVYYVNHYGNFLSLFHPEIISNIELYKGSFPARYGGRLSSVVDLRMREGNKKEHKGSFGIGLLSADLMIEGPIKKDKTSYLLSGRRFYLDAIMRPFTYFISEGISVGYQFYDVYGKIAHTFNENNRLYLSVYTGEDVIGVSLNPWDDVNFKGKMKTGWGNLLVTSRLNSKLSANTLGDLVLGYTRYGSIQSQEFEVDSNSFYWGVESKVQDYFLRTEVSQKFSNKYELKYGGGLVYHSFQPGITKNINTIGSKTVLNNQFGSVSQDGLESYVFVENIIRPIDFLKLNIGLRNSGYWVDKSGYYSLEPRLLAVVGNERRGVVKMSYSKNMQPLHLLSYQSIGTPTDLWMPATKNIKPAMASQVSIGYAKTIAEKYELSIELYNKKLSNLIAYKDGVSYQSTELDWQNKVEVDGIGTSKGVELLLKKSVGKTNGWIGYTLSKTDRQFKNKNNGKSYPYIYDRRHDLSLVFNHKFNKKFNLSASWVLSSGYPITLEIGQYSAYELKGYIHDRLVDDEESAFELRDNVVLYSGKHSVRMKYSHRLDIGFQINGKTKKGRDKTWSFNVYNVYNQQNPAYYFYDWKSYTDRSKGKVLYQQSGLPIIPSFTYRVRW